MRSTLFDSVLIGALSIRSAFAQNAANWSSREWDVIVVGAGPAGIIVADRMSEANKSTLLLEGGGSSYSITGGRERPDWLNGTSLSRVDVPGLYKSIFADGGDLVCGNLTSEYGGCTIGGSSAINAGLFFEPPASDYDLYFPDGWKSKDMKAATARLYARELSSSTTSQDRQLYLQSGYEVAKEWLVDSAEYKDVDINRHADDKLNVFGRPIFNYQDSARGGPVRTYLQAALSRSNFQLEAGVRVSSIARNGTKATGVYANVDGRMTLLKLADQGRVVVSGGAIFSPQLLMNSGIGQIAALQNLSSTGLLNNYNASQWINNSAVGQGLFDNPNTFIELQSPNVTSYTYSYDSPIIADAQNYVFNRSGPYSFASETSVFWSYLNSTRGRQVGLQGTIDSAGFGGFTDNNTITLNIYGTSGLGSRGSVILDKDGIPGASKDVYYSDPQDGLDIATFIHSIFSKLPTSLTPLNIPRNASIAEIQKYITTPSQYAVGKVNHWSSSCKIGACVDVNTTVIGTDNIHVVDGSIIEPVTVNPQFAIMAAAEHASDLILQLQ